MNAYTFTKNQIATFGSKLNIITVTANGYYLESVEGKMITTQKAGSKDANKQQDKNQAQCREFESWQSLQSLPGAIGKPCRQQQQRRHPTVKTLCPVEVLP